MTRGDTSTSTTLLSRAHPWPAERPVCPTRVENPGWLGEGTERLLARELSAETRLVVELGAWLGLSTRFLVSHASKATVISVDHWLGSPEHRQRPEFRAMLPSLYETFLSLCWPYRERIIPLRMSTLDGLRTVAEYRLVPDLIYIDAEHSYTAVSAELGLARELFPQATLVGDDYDWTGVQEAVVDFARRSGRAVERVGTRGWKLCDPATARGAEKGDRHPASKALGETQGPTGPGASPLFPRGPEKGDRHPASEVLPENPGPMGPGASPLFPQPTTAKPRVFMGMGAGHCGLAVLAGIMAEQRSTRVSIAQLPLLPWNPRANGPGIRERIERWRASEARLVGDVAAFYLPYVEEAVATEPEIRMVCLVRPEDEIVTGFKNHLDRNSPIPLNHWTRDLAPGWTHHPLLTQTYPQYDDPDRDAGLKRYWREYYHRADELQRRYPRNFRIVDAEELAKTEGVRALLDFIGVPRESQVVVTGRSTPPAAETTAAPAVSRPPLDPKRCLVLVPFGGPILAECEEGLRELERRGYTVRRIGGYAAIDQGRSQIATDALVEGFEETLWIDSDIGFRPDDVEVLRRHALPIVCGIYPQKGTRALACHILPGTSRMTFGEGGGLVEILYAGAGFLLVRREVYLAIQAREKLPVCNERFGRPSIPYFLPMLRAVEDGHWYLGEDYAFCERARRCGFKVLADTTIRLWHVGPCRYGWEDAGTERPRFGTFTVDLI